MKILVILSLAVLVTACGGKSTSSVKTLIPGTPVNNTTTSYVMTGTVSEPGDIQNNSTAIQTSYSNATVSVPASLISVLNLTEDVRATLTLGGCQFYYRQFINSSNYQLQSGTCATTPVSVPNNSVLTLSIDTGYATQTTSAQVTLVVTKQ